MKFEPSGRGLRRERVIGKGKKHTNVPYVPFG